MKKLVNPNKFVMLGLFGCLLFSSCGQNGKSGKQNDVGEAELLDSTQKGKTVDQSTILADSISKVYNAAEDADVKKNKRDSLALEAAKKDSIKKQKFVFDSTGVKYIYLSFDDGPLNGSQKIDSIATAKGVKISVFLIGKHDKMSKKLNSYYERYKANPLVDCYNHSYSHANNKYETFYKNPQKAFEDFDNNEKVLGLQHKIVRLPGRNIWHIGSRSRVDIPSAAATADLLAQNGYKIMGWDCEWKINPVTGKPDLTVDQLYTRMQNLLRKGSSYTKNNVVLLTHDPMYNTKKGQQLLSELIDKLKSNPNYKFEFLRDYPGN